jgi:hypothetical protein
MPLLPVLNPNLPVDPLLVNIRLATYVCQQGAPFWHPVNIWDVTNDDPAADWYWTTLRHQLGFLPYILGRCEDVDWHIIVR